MAYATAADVASRVPNQMWAPTGTSQPSNSKVGEWLDGISAFIDGSLRWKYTVPVVDATDLLVLQQVTALLVAAQVWDVLGGHGGQEPEASATMRKTAYTMLAYNVRDGRSYLVLPGTAVSDSGEAAVGQPLGSFTDPDEAGSVPRFFTTSMDF